MSVTHCREEVSDAVRQWEASDAFEYQSHCPTLLCELASDILVVEYG